MPKSIDDIKTGLTTRWNAGWTWTDLYNQRTAIAVTGRYNDNVAYTGAYDINGIYDWTWTYTPACDCDCACSK